ncbi:unnamed protein product [Durusdinium trenchii]|uniref:Uncharacterized protein n=1 Tax=Durusdinium trenchii TaxID=1381693 RepID=A0ABP0Q3B9_9DINO
MAGLLPSSMKSMRFTNATLRQQRLRYSMLCVLAVCFSCHGNRPSPGPYKKAMPCAVGATDNPRRQVLGARDEFDIEDDRPVRSPGTATSSSAREGALPERRRNIRTPPVVEDIIAGALVGAVTGAAAGAGSGAALGGAGTNGLAGAAGGAASGAALGLASGAFAGAALATANPDVAAAGVGAAGIGAAAGVVAVLNRVQIRDQYAQWPPPPVVPQFADRPAMVPPSIENVIPQAPASRQEEVRDDTPPPPESKEADTAKSGEVVQETPPSTSSTPESHKSDEHKTGQAHRQPWKRASAVSLRRANNMLSAEIEAKSGEVVAKGLDDLGILLSQLQQLQAACQAAIAQATEKTIQRARPVREDYCSKVCNDLILTPFRIGFQCSSELVGYFAP